MGSMHVRKDGKVFELDDTMTGAQVKQVIDAPSDAVLINARNQTISDNDEIGQKVADGEAIATVPQFEYWKGA